MGFYLVYLVATIFVQNWIVYCLVTSYLYLLYIKMSPLDPIKTIELAITYFKKFV